MDNASGVRALRVAIVGCGRVAAHHARFITNSSRARLVAVADANPARAEQFRSTYGAEAGFDSLEPLLDQARPDVLHVVTPPADHVQQATLALQRGVHVLIEKPVTYTAAAASGLYDLAAQRGLLLCPNFIQLFTPVMLRARALAESGTLGRITHVECYQGLDLDIGELREALGLHWSYELPGGILRNYLTHPLYLIQHWTGRPNAIHVSARSLGSLPQNITDHIVVHIDGARCTGTAVLTARGATNLFEVRLMGERGTITVDFGSLTMTSSIRSYWPRNVDRATGNFVLARQLRSYGIGNIVGVLRRRIVPYQGLEALIERFYGAIQSGQRSAPVTRELAIEVTEVEEQVFDRLTAVRPDVRDRPSRLPASTGSPIVVTGATGYLGCRLLKQLVAAGYDVRALVRPSSKISDPERLGVALCFGDVRDPASLHRIFAGAGVVVHMAAGLKGSPEFMMKSTVDGTRNVADIAREAGVSRVLYVSSMAVYDFSSLPENGALTEGSALDPQPAVRGVASIAKREAEEIALAEMRADGPAWTIIRPGVLVGSGRPSVETVGVRLGNSVLCLGGPRKRLRLMHVDDAAAAIVCCLNADATRGKVYNLCQPETIRQVEYARYVSAENPGVKVLFVRRWFASTMAAAVGAMRLVTKRVPRIDRRRLDYLFRSASAASDRFTADTGWAPTPNLLARLKSEISTHRNTMSA